MIQLSKRLQAVADLVYKCNTLADVGTDHGYIPVYLVGYRKAERAIALDVNQGPLSRAEEHIRQYGMADRIETRLSDGCSALKPGDADVIVISGMGGALMKRILQQGEAVCRKAGGLVLQPQSELMAFRKFLYESGYEFTAEDMVWEEGKYYPVIAVHFAGSQKDDITRAAEWEEAVFAPLVDSREHASMREQSRRIIFRYGPLLLAQRHPVLKEYLLNQQKQKQKILLNLRKNARQNVESRIGEVTQELEELETALRLFYDSSIEE